RRRRKLIRARRGDGANQPSQIVTMRDEIRRERVQQRRMRGWIGWTQIVHRLDEAATEQVFPDAIDGGAREEWIVRRGKPRGKFDAAVMIDFGGTLWGAEWFRRKRLARLRMIDFAPRADFDHTTVLCDAGEISGEAMIVFLRPVIRRM